MSPTPRERVLAALRLQAVDRTPWVPFVGCHAASLIDKSASEFLQSEELMVSGVQAAIDRYNPDGIPVIFDLQLEAEAMGCQLVWADGNPPSVASHPLAEGVELKDITAPDPSAGRIGLVLAATEKIRKANPDVALYGLLTGPFTLALHLLGTNIFMDMFDNPDKVNDLLAFCGDIGVTMAKAFIERGLRCYCRGGPDDQPDRSRTVPRVHHPSCEKSFRLHPRCRLDIQLFCLWPRPAEYRSHVRMRSGQRIRG